MMEDDEQSLSFWIDENFNTVTDEPNRRKSTSPPKPSKISPTKHSYAVAGLISSRNDGSSLSTSHSFHGVIADKSDQILIEAANLLKRHENILSSKRLIPKLSSKSLNTALSTVDYSELSCVVLTAVVKFDNKEGPTLVLSVPEIEDQQGISQVPADFGRAVHYMLPFKSLPETSSGASDLSSSNEDQKFMFLFKTEESGSFFGASHFIRLQDDKVERGFSQGAVVVLSRVPYVGLLLQRLQSFSAEVLNKEDCLTQLTNFHKSLCRISFSELGYSLAYQDLPVIRLLTHLRYHVMSLVRLILLEGRILVYSKNPSLLSASVYAIASLFPGCLAFGLTQNPIGFDVRAYRWRKFGFPFDLFLGSHMRFEPLLVMAEVTEVLSSPGFLAGTTNSMIQSMSAARLDAFVNLDTDTVQSMNTPLARAAFALGDDGRAFIQSLVGEAEYHVHGSSYEAETEWTGSGAWAADQFQLFFEEMGARAAGALARAKMDELIVGEEVSSQSSDVSTNSAANHSSLPIISSFFGQATTNFVSMASSWLKSDEQLSPALLSVQASLRDYGKSWVMCWMRTKNFETWCQQQMIPDEELLCRPTHKRIVKSRSMKDVLSRSRSNTPQSGYHLYKYRNGDTYIGRFSEGKREGFGCYTEHSTGNVYEGHWKENKRHGRGVLTSGKRDLIYDGDWENDERTGLGQCVMNGRETYVGSWSKGLFHGQGKHCDGEGNVYEGEWVRGVREGAGRMIAIKQSTPKSPPTDSELPKAAANLGLTSRSSEFNEEYTYVGEWKNGLRDGLGQCIYHGKSSYSGQWREGKWWGEGKLTYDDGTVFEGEFLANEKHGIGAVSTPEGTVYEGTWKRGFPVEASEWRVRFSNGDDYVGTVRLCEDGSIEPHERGTYKYSNGDVYTGEFQKGVRSGYGLCVFINGERFEGRWVNDEISLLGKGQLTLADGTSHNYT